MTSADDYNQKSRQTLEFEVTGVCEEKTSCLRRGGELVTAAGGQRGLLET